MSRCRSLWPLPPRQRSQHLELEASDLENYRLQDSKIVRSRATHISHRQVLHYLKAPSVAWVKRTRGRHDGMVHPAHREPCERTETSVRLTQKDFQGPPQSSPQDEVRRTEGGLRRHDFLRQGPVFVVFRETRINHDKETGKDCGLENLFSVLRI